MSEFTSCPKLPDFIDFRLQEFIDEGVGAIKDYFQNIVFLLMSDVNGRQMITKTSVLGKQPCYVWA